MQSVQIQSDLDSCQARATKEYLEGSENPEACFQCFANGGALDDVRFQMFHEAGCVMRHFDAIHLNEEPLECN